MNSFHQLANRCEKALLNCQLACGGWSYGKSRQWATEPTALALLALRVRPGANCRKGVAFLESCQRPDGSWPAFEGDEEGSWATALAVIALARVGGNWFRVQRGAASLLQVRGQESHWLTKWRYRLFDRQVRFDPDKYGWPWTNGAASWVVPTSYSLIALRLAFGCCLPLAVKERIQEGTAMLFDRGCPGGGWNAGNGMVFGVPLEPHIDVTSLALLALRPFRDDPFVKRSLAWLQREFPFLVSTYGLACALVALAAYKCDTSSAKAKLADLSSELLNPDPDSGSLVLLAIYALWGANPF
jgi:Prenyltransferase and squalene oxidase repeat